MKSASTTVETSSPPATQASKWYPRVSRVLTAASLVAAASSCHAQALRTDGELVRVLARLARGGAPEDCNAALVGKELGVEIGPLTEFVRDEPPPFRSQWTEQITCLPGGPPIKAARFERLRSGREGGCEIRVEYESLRMCDAPPGRVKGLIGIESIAGPPRPHGTAYGHEHWFTSNSGHKSALQLVRCFEFREVDDSGSHAGAGADSPGGQRV